MNRIHLLFLALTGAAAAEPAQEQLVRQHDGIGVELRYGSAVAGIGDVDGDGLGDYAIGASNHTTTAVTRAGIVEVRSGASGALLARLEGSTPGADYGSSLTAMGDVDLDGVPDFALGATEHRIGMHTQYGRVEVISGATFDLIMWMDGSSPTSRFGTSIASVADVDGDGIRELLVGIPLDDAFGQQSGEARVIDGTTGRTLINLYGDAPNQRLGHCVAALGDVDGDGVDDFAAGAYRASVGLERAGYVRVYSGATGAELYTVLGTDRYDEFGRSVVGLGDVDGDGVPDVAAGSIDDDDNGSSCGSVRVFSGVDGSTIYTVYGDEQDDQLGSTLARLGDIDGDGIEELAIGIAGSVNTFDESGAVRVVRVTDGAVLVTLEGTRPEDRFGSSIAGVGDIDGDGLAEWLVGALEDDTDTGWNSGSATLFGWRGPSGAISCLGVDNSTGSRGLVDVLGSHTIASTDLELAASALPMGSTLFFLASQQASATLFPAGSAGRLCLGGTIGRFVAPGQVLDSGSSGAATLPIDPTALPQPTTNVAAASGESWYFQAWYRDTVGGQPTSNFTDAVRVDFQ